jgi:hypothetical protein
MSERIQHTAAFVREQMNNRYSDGFDHKHNKHHHSYRQHCRSHPAKTYELNGDENQVVNDIGLIKSFKLKKTRKRQNNKSYH